MRLVAAIVLLFVTVACAHKTALERRQKFSPSDFTLDLNDGPVIQGLGIPGRPALGAQMPILNGLGISYVEITFEPCGINLPHVHPRATELQYIISGSKLQVGVAEENGGRTIIRNISEGMVAVAEQGLLHFECNNGCDDVKFLAALTSEDPGVLSFPDRLYGFPNNPLGTAFGVSNSKLRDIEDAASMRSLRNQCLRRCRSN